MDKYAATSARRDSFSQAGFLAAKIFTDTLLKMDPKAINRASVTKAVRAIHGYRTDLSCGPYYFGPLSIHDSNHAARVVADTGTGFKFVGKCFEIKDPELAPILKAETKLHLTK